MQRIVREDAIGQLRRRHGEMARLGSEDGALKLDWVEGVARLLQDTQLLAQIEAEASDLWNQGIRHIIWSGMGGSVITVRVLADLGFCDGHNGSHIAIYPLDSTDPAALNSIVRQIAISKQLAIPDSTDSAFLRSLLQDVMMIGVSMGMTSEEPMTHLEWFTACLKQAQLPIDIHLMVMTLPGSYLDTFAQQHHIPSRPLQPDGGTGTGGRMSAPATRVFLLPAALYLTRTFQTSGLLRSVLQQAWQQYNLDLATHEPAEHPFVQLAALLSDNSVHGAARLLIDFSEEWQGLLQWIEQLMEESLGKGGKGIVAFSQQPLNVNAPTYHADGLLSVHVTTGGKQKDSSFTITQPYLSGSEGQHRLAAVATQFLNWQLCMSLYGYLQGIQFAGQPAVENYKARARALRATTDPLSIVKQWPDVVNDNELTLLTPSGTTLYDTAVSTFVHALRHIISDMGSLDYLDITFNGAASQDVEALIGAYQRTTGNYHLGLPVKVRRAPAAYHSTEQSEMDGPPHLVSLRILATQHEQSLIGTYTDDFLRAQAVSTWQAMIDVHRPCFLLLYSSEKKLRSFFEDVTIQFNNVERG